MRNVSPRSGVANTRGFAAEGPIRPACWQLLESVALGSGTKAAILRGSSYLTNSTLKRGYPSKNAFV